MNTKPTWTILIATLGQRQEKFAHLLDILMPQVEEFNGKIQVMAYWNNGELPLGTIRQLLIDEATTDYVSFIDDDDEVPPNFCKEVYRRLGKVDYVGWRMQAYNNGEPLKPTYHSISYEEWYDDEKGFYRNISHLNPIKRDIAMKGSFISEQGVAEDKPWADQVAPFVKTESFIPDVMYMYYHEAEDSKWRGVTGPQNYTQPTVERRYFRFY